MVQIARQTNLIIDDQITPTNLNAEFNNLVYNWNGHDDGQLAFTSPVFTSATFNTLIVKALVAGVQVVTTGSSYTVAATDFVVVVNKGTGSATTINLPGSPTTGRFIVVKDGKGDSVTNNITVAPAAGTIDGAATFVIASDYNSATFVYNGTQWNEISQTKL